MVKPVIKNVAKGLGQIGRDLVDETLEQPMAALGMKPAKTSPAPTGPGGKTRSAADLSRIKDLAEQDKIASEAEMAQLRQQLGGGEKPLSSQGRDVEKEMEIVREKRRVEARDKAEEEAMEQLEKQRQEEEEKAAQDSEAITPLGKKPRGLAPWVQKGTKESGVRKSV